MLLNRFGDIFGPEMIAHALPFPARPPRAYLNLAHDRKFDMNITRRTAAIGGLSVLAGNAISKTARAEFGEGLRDIGEGLESGLPGQIGMASRSVARNFLSRLTYHSRLMASRRVLQRSEWSKIHCRPRVDLAPSPALCCWSRLSMSVVQPT